VLTGPVGTSAGALPWTMTRSGILRFPEWGKCTAFGVVFDDETAG
jgi:hypothetical protein